MKAGDMAFAFSYDVPIGEDVYRKIQDGLGPEVPDGLVAHVALRLPEGGLRYIDVWRSEEDSERFAEERLHPVVHPLLEEMLGFTPPEPERTPLEVIHVWSEGGSFDG
jgi:hypothetical protein